MNTLNSLTLITCIYILVLCLFVTQNNTDKSAGEVSACLNITGSKWTSWGSTGLNVALKWH